MPISKQWLFALILIVLPSLSLMPIGVWWLWQHGWTLYWMGGALLIGGLGTVWALFLRYRQIAVLKEHARISAAESWDANSQAAWQMVKDFADELDSNDYDPQDYAQLFQLSKTVVDKVSRHFHPKSSRALWEVPLPYVLRIIELVCADLRENIVENVPGSHLLTLHDMVRGKQLANFAKRGYDIYRIISPPLNPAGALLRELRDYATRQIVGTATSNLRAWLLETYVRKVGYYAIELYNGKLLLNDSVLREYRSPDRQKQDDTTNTTSPPVSYHTYAEPLRIGVIGAVGSGKTQLIHALLDYTPLPMTVDQEGFSTYVLSLIQCEQVLWLLEVPSYTTLGEEEWAWTTRQQQRLLEFDMLIWVCDATRNDWVVDKTILNQLDILFQNRLQSALPPLLVVANHIDKLPPVQEWQPPYDLSNLDDDKQLKVQHIKAMLAKLSAQFINNDIIPVCLHPQRRYNVTETLRPCFMETLVQAQQWHYQRCLRAVKQQGHIQQVTKQALNAGKVLLKAALWGKEGK